MRLQGKEGTPESLRDSPSQIHDVYQEATATRDAGLQVLNIYQAQKHVSPRTTASRPSRCLLRSPFECQIKHLPCVHKHVSFPQRNNVIQELLCSTLEQFTTDQVKATRPGTNISASCVTTCW